MERFNAYLQESRLSKTVATEIALETFLDKEDLKKQILENGRLTESQKTRSE